MSTFNGQNPFQPLKPVCSLNFKTVQFLLHKESPSPQFKEITRSHPKHINTLCGEKKTRVKAGGTYNFCQLRSLEDIWSSRQFIFN